MFQSLLFYCKNMGPGALQHFLIFCDIVACKKKKLQWYSKHCNSKFKDFIVFLLNIKETGLLIKQKDIRQ